MEKTLKLTKEIVSALNNLAIAKFDKISLKDAQDQLAKASELAHAIISLPPFEDSELTLQELKELRAENETQQNILLERSEKIHQQQETITVLTAAAKINSTIANQPAERLPRHPDPDKFDGTRSKLRGFLGQLRLKISDRRSYPTAQDQLRYATSRLEGIALDQILPLIVDDCVDLEDFPAFVNVLTNAFDDPDRAGTAQRALRSLKQGNRDFATYYAEFQRHASDTGYDNTAKRAALRDGLSRELQTCLLPIAEPEKLSDFVELCQRIDQKIRRMAPQNRTHSVEQHARNAPAIRGTPTTATGTHPGPMDMSAFRHKLSPEEKLKRIREGRCLYCGEFGHMAKECPFKIKPPVGSTVTGSENSGKALSQA